MSANDKRTPDWLLERIAAGDMEPGKLKAARAQLESEPDGLARLAALEASNRDILERYPAVGVEAEVLRRQALAARQPAQGRRWWPVLVGAPAAAAVALLLLVQPFGGDEVGRPGADAGLEATRLKGLKPQLKVFRQQTEGAVELADGASARAGDLLQLAYRSGGRRHGVLLSIDGRGTITRHLPKQGDASALLEGGGEQRLSFSYELDDAPGFERFFLIVCESPLEVAAALRAAEALARSPERAARAALALPEDCLQAAVLLNK